MPRAARLLLLAALAAAVLGALPAGAGAASRTVWLCKPGLRHNPCETSLTTTVLSPSGERRAVRRIRPDQPRSIDCFYVYPTVSDQKRTYATRSKDPEIVATAYFEAARWSQRCRVFVPMYRQRTLATLTHRVGGNLLKSPPYVDVRNAWHEYLRRYNHGRGVVLIGHSQGTFLLRALMAREVDRRPAVRRRIVSALLFGGNVLVKKGSGRGGDFQHIRACRSARQLGCVIAFSTFNGPVPQDTFFGRTDRPGMQVLCTNPAALAGGSGRLTPILPTKPFPRGTSVALAIALLGNTFPVEPTPWISAPGAYTGRCSSADGANVLQVAPVGAAPRLNPSPTPQWGLHFIDANGGLGNLLAVVRTQATLYARRH